MSGAPHPTHAARSLRAILTAVALAAGAGQPALAADDLRLVEAARRNDPAAVRVLLAEGLDVDARHPDGSTALLWAAHYDDAETAALLIAAGADVDAANDYGESPLSQASRNGNAGLVGALLAAGADPHAVKPTGETLLMTAARAGSSAVADLLLARGVAVGARESANGQTALMLAAAHRQHAVARALIAAGADVNAASTRGSTALHFAVQQGDVPLARLLLAAGASVHAALTVRQMDQFTLGLVETFDRQTPLWLAITNCRRDGLEYFGSTEPHPVSLTCPVNAELGALFLAHGADPNAADGAGFRPLHRAAQAGMTELVEALLAHGADPDARVPADARQWTGENRGGARTIAPVPNGATPLFIAAWTHNPEIMRTLLAAGADPHLAAADGTPPLAAAAGTRGRPPLGYSRHLDTPRMLAAVRIALDAGADVDAANAAGRTAMHGAAALGSTALIGLLAERGARVDVEDNEGRTPLNLATESGGYEETASDGAAALLRKLAEAQLSHDSVKRCCGPSCSKTHRARTSWPISAWIPWVRRSSVSIADTEGRSNGVPSPEGIRKIDRSTRVTRCGSPPVDGVWTSAVPLGSSPRWAVTTGWIHESVAPVSISA